MHFRRGPLNSSPLQQSRASNFTRLMSIDNAGINYHPVLFWFFLTLSFVEQLEQIKSTLFANVSPVPSTSEGHQTLVFEFHAEFWEGASTNTDIKWKL